MVHTLTSNKGDTAQTLMSHAKNSVFPVYTSTLKTEILNIFTLEGALQKVFFQRLKTPFAFGQKAKTHRKRYVLKEYLCPCGLHLNILNET